MLNFKVKSKGIAHERAVATARTIFNSVGGFMEAKEKGFPAVIDGEGNEVQAGATAAEFNAAAVEALGAEAVENIAKVAEILGYTPDSAKEKEADKAAPAKSKAKSKR